MRSRIGTTPDVARLSEAVSRPGIDPRAWVEPAVIDGESFVDLRDGKQGIFVNVYILRTGTTIPARLGALYAGNGFGFYLPVEDGDEVQVLVPNGETDEGPVVLPRLWSASDPPPAELKTGPAADRGPATADLLLLAKAGATIRIAAQGEGNAVLEARGTGKVFLGGETGTLPAARQTDPVSVNLVELQAALDARYVLIAGTPVPITTPVTGTITSGSSKVEVK